MKTKNENSLEASVLDMLEEEFQTLTAIEQGRIIGGSGGMGSGGIGSGGPMCDPLSSTQLGFIKTAEGYQDQVTYDRIGDCYSVGYGHKLTEAEEEQYNNGIFDDSAAHLNQLFLQDVQHARDIVNNNVTNQSITQGQYLSMVDLVYNAGGGDFVNSNMLADVNNGNFSAASNEFEHWNAQGVQGLDTRRANEQNMFNYSGSGDPGIGYTYQWGIQTDYWDETHDD